MPTAFLNQDEFLVLCRRFLQISWYVHRLPGCKPVKHKPRTNQIRDEVKKLFEAGFLEVIKYPDWVANIVPVPKKGRKIRMCVDYQDLNEASPKDEFKLPHIDIIIHNTAKCSMLSFMAGYNPMA